MRLAPLLPFLALALSLGFTDTFAQSQSQNPAAQMQQTGRLTGTLVDAQNKPVSYATVTLLRADS